METKLILKKVNVVSVLERKPTMQVLMPPHPNQETNVNAGSHASTSKSENRIMFRFVLLSIYEFDTAASI